MSELPIIDPYDRANSQSLWFKVGEGIKKHMLSVSEDVRYKPLEDLKKEGKPTPILIQFRFNLWKAYQSRLADPKNKNFITITEICKMPGEYINPDIKEVSVQTTVHRHLDRANEHALAFLFCPLRNFERTMEECLDIGLERVLEIMHLPIKDRDGEIDHKTANLVLKAYEMVKNDSLVIAKQKAFSEVGNLKSLEPPKSLEALEAEVRALQEETQQKILPTAPVLDPVQYFEKNIHGGAKSEQIPEILKGE